MARRTKYHVDTQTRILDSHKQFMGGLKTVDTDDSLKGFFLRDAENISLSEFGFLERRYGLVNDANFEFLVPGVQQEFIDPLTGARSFKDRLQGYFEYVRPDRVTETIMFYNGRLYLNKVQVTKLYQYPQTFDPKLGLFNTNIANEDFKLYLERVHNYTDFTSFDAIDDLFNTGRPIEGVRIENRMFFFTGIYPIVYEGTGEFYILPEFQANFTQLALFSHNLHTSNLDKTYTEGFPASEIDDVDLTELEQPYFGEIGYAPMFPYMVGEGRGLNLTVNFKVPDVAPYNREEFQRFITQGAKQNQNQQGSQFLELLPEVYYRPVGLATPQDGADLSIDRTWTRLGEDNVEFFLEEQDSFVQISSFSNATSTTLIPQHFAYENDDPEREEDDTLTYPDFFSENRFFDEDGVRLATRRPLYVSDSPTRKLKVRITGLPSRMLDIRIDYVTYQAGYQQILLEQAQSDRFEQKIVARRTEIFPSITVTARKTADYLQFVRVPRLEFVNFAAFPVPGETGNIYVDLSDSKEYVWDETIHREAAENEKTTPVPVNDPAALWTCNKVINHYGKLMAYGSTIYPERVFIGHPQFVHYFPFFFTRDFDSGDVKPILQITPFMNILVVQNDTYSWGLKGIDAVLGAENFYTPFVISPIYGTIAPNSVRPIRNQLFFLSADGIVSLQSLYAIDDQYNVKHIDKNIENIIPLDPEAVAIQYDNQYWIHFPNTPEFLTLRYHVDLKAWMKDTYFQFDGLDANGVPQKSNTIFNGIHKYIRFEDKLIFITNPMKFASKVNITGAETNYRVLKLYVDYSMATDLEETPRTLFETSYLDQDHPFNEKRYMEQKMDFTIQNEYHLGKEPIFRDESMTMVPDLGNDETGNPIHQFTMYRLPLVKNHDYEINVPQQGAPAYTNPKANIKAINVRLFDIQGNLLRTLNFREQKPPTPSLLNLQTFVASNQISFEVYNNDVVANDIRYRLTSTAPGAVNPIIDNTESSVASNATELVTVSNVPFGPLTLELIANRTGVTPVVESQSRIRHFQLEDGVFDIFVFNPIEPSRAPLALTAIATGANNIANAIELTWVDQNPASSEYRISFRNLTTQSGILGSQTTTEPNFTLNFTSQQATDVQGNVFQFEVQALYNGNLSIAAVIATSLELFSEVPGTITDLSAFQLSDRLRFQWTDVQFESNYQVEWRYLNEPVAANFAAREADRKAVLSQNSNNYFFAIDATNPNLPLIFTNAVVEFKARGINPNGQSAQDAIHQGVFQQHYDHTTFIGEKLDGQSGFRVTIPDAAKTTKYGGSNNPYVSEYNWGVQIRKQGVSSFDDELIIPATTNSFDIINLDPDSIYEIRVRSRFEINGSDLDPLAFSAAMGIFEVESGNEVAVPLTNPTITNISRPLPFQDATSTTQTNPILLSFDLTNTDAKKAQIHYAVNTQFNYTVTTSDPSTGELNAQQSQSFSGITVNPGSTVYIHARAFPAVGVNAEPSSGFRSAAQSIAALVTGTFFHNSSVWVTRTGYAPYTVQIADVPLPSGTVGWSPALPRTFSSNTTFTSVAQTLARLATPTGVFIDNITNNGARVSWNAVSGATNGYDVLLNPDNLTFFSSSPSFTFSGLVPDTFYSAQIRARATTSNTASFYSSAVGFNTTGAIVNPPAMPSSATFSKTGDFTWSLSWASVSAATSYDYQISTSSNFSPGTLVVNTSTTNTSASGSVQAGVVHYARVRAQNTGGPSDWRVASPTNGILFGSGGAL